MAKTLRMPSTPSVFKAGHPQYSARISVRMSDEPCHFATYLKAEVDFALCRKHTLSQCHPNSPWDVRCTSCAPKTKVKWPSYCGRYAALTSFRRKQLLSDNCLLQVIELERELTQCKAQGKKVCQQPAISCNVNMLHKIYCHTMHEADRLDTCLYWLRHALFVQEKIELQEKTQHLRQRSADMLHENNT